MTLVSRESTAEPDAGIRARVAEDGSLIFRRDRGETAYQLRIVHEWITQAELDAIESFITANGYGPHDVVGLKGKNYTVTLTNDPVVLDHKGPRYMVGVPALGVRA